jgi:ribosomal protein S18 acetylase RimI-like enzyme
LLSWERLLEKSAGDVLKIVIRKATKRDFSKLVEIFNESAGKGELEGFVPPTSETEKFLVQLRQKLEFGDQEVLVADVNQKSVGFIYFIQEKDHFAIEEIDVAKQHQGRGIGKALVNSVEDLARNKGTKCLTTGTAINSEGEPWKAYGFWLHLGYVDTGERTQPEYGFKYCKLVKKLQI